jgi:diguanylate cyclase (GGDEF)-like protein
MMPPKIPLVSGSLKKRLWTIIILVGAYLVYISLGDLIPDYWKWIGFRTLERSILTLGFVVILLICLSGLAMSDKLTTLAIRDGLTGLYNSTYIKARLQEEIDRAGRYGDPLSLLMIDPDDFKSLNDTFGQVAGDRILRAFSDLLRNSLRAPDIVGRIGGEEFLVILPRTSSLDAAAVAERIRRVISSSEFRLFPRGDKTCHLTISIGVFGSPDRDQNVDEVIGLADAALFRAKNEGKNKVVIYIK